MSTLSGYHHRMGLRFHLAAGVFGAFWLGAAAAAPASLCAQLATQAWQSPATTWESDSPLDHWVSVEQSNDGIAEGDQATVYGLLTGALWAQLQSPHSAVEFEHLTGEHLYMGEHIAGSGHCQTLAFAVAYRHQFPRLLPLPQGYTSPCSTPGLEGDLGMVLGHAAYIEMGVVGGPTIDPLIRITSWVHKGWGRACRLTIRLRYQFRPTTRFCGNQSVCQAAGNQAADIARAYFEFRSQAKFRMLSIAPNLETPVFQYGNGSTPAMDSAVMRAWHVLVLGHKASDFFDIHLPDFPAFNKGTDSQAGKYPFSGSYFALFPLILNGRLYVGAAGLVRAPACCQDNTRTLFAVYDVPESEDQELVPLAGFVVDMIPNGVEGTDVAEGRAAVSRPTER